MLFAMFDQFHLCSESPFTYGAVELFWIIPSVSSHGSVFTTGINVFAAVNLSRVGYLSRVRCIT